MSRWLHHRYTQLAVLTLAGGAIYPLLYLRQNFEVSLLATYHIELEQLASHYTWLGAIFVATYLPSGWLADRFSPRRLIVTSLTATGLLGLWFASVPSAAAIRWIFIGWGLATGLTFWAALIKSVSLLAPHDRQASYFGWLDGGRGLVEALLATLAVALFAWLAGSDGAGTARGMRWVVLMYSGVVLAAAAIAAVTLRVARDAAPTAGGSSNGREVEDSGASDNLWHKLMPLIRQPRVWLAAFCILAGYQLFWATYTLSALLQQQFSMTAVAAGTITVAKLWMRPVGAIGAGLIGDRVHPMPMLAVLLAVGAATLMLLSTMPVTSAGPLLIGLVLLLGLSSYGARGIYWASLDDCGVPAHSRGLAIGLISLLGYLPDMLSPMLQGALLDPRMGRVGYNLYFSLTAGVALLGALAALGLQRLTPRRW